MVCDKAKLHWQTLHKLCSCGAHDWGGCHVDDAVRDEKCTVVFAFVFVSFCFVVLQQFVSSGVLVLLLVGWWFDLLVFGSGFDSELLLGGLHCFVCCCSVSGSSTCVLGCLQLGLVTL